jgi:hypothetical protein
MPALTTAEANRLLDASLGTATYTAPTTPMKLALATSASTASAPGTEVSGGSYARQTIAFGSAASGSASSSGVITFSNMPACTVTYIDIYDSNGTPRRCWWGALTASKTLAAGDSIAFSSAAVSAALS